MRAIYDTLDRILPAHNVAHYGICPYDDALLITPRGSAVKIPSGAKSVIACLFPYFIGFSERNISRYAAVRDYHGVAGDILESLCEALRNEYPDDDFAPFVDASPVREVEAARLAGLGDIGMNGLLIQKKHGESIYGSYVFIGTIATTAEAEPSTPGGYCEKCGKCVKACPNGALNKGSLEPGKCRSLITQKRKNLTGWERDQIKQGGLVWGCDICQDACSYNETARETLIKAFSNGAKPIITADNLEALYPNRAFNYRDISVVRRNLEIINESPRVKMTDAINRGTSGS